MGKGWKGENNRKGKQRKGILTEKEKILKRKMAGKEGKWQERKNDTKRGTDRRG